MSPDYVLFASYGNDSVALIHDKHVCAITVRRSAPSKFALIWVEADWTVLKTVAA